MAFGVAELFYKPIQYYLHERVWYRFIKFGLVEEKKKKPTTDPKPKTNEVIKIELENPKTKKGKRLSYSKKTV